MKFAKFAWKSKGWLLRKQLRRLRHQSFVNSSCFATSSPQPTNSGDEAEYREKNRQLRFATYQAAQSQTLLAVIEALWLQVGPFLVYVTKNLSIHNEIDHHYALLAALTVRDGAAARLAIARDTFENGELLLSVGRFSPEPD